MKNKESTFNEITITVTANGYSVRLGREYCMANNTYSFESIGSLHKWIDLNLTKPEDQ